MLDKLKRGEAHFISWSLVLGLAAGIMIARILSEVQG